MSCSEVWASVLAALCTAKLGDCQKLGKTAHKKAGPIASVLAAWCTAMLGDCPKNLLKNFTIKGRPITSVLPTLYKVRGFFLNFGRTVITQLVIILTKKNQLQTNATIEQK